MADFSLEAETILRFWERPLPEDGASALQLYADAVAAAGPALPFVLTKQGLEGYPYAELGGNRVLPSDLSPLPGEVWVVFCFHRQFAERAVARTLLRTDGFMLVLEWRKGEADSALLSSAFHALAALVRKQQNVTGWGLHPAFFRYQDKVDFTDRSLFADDAHVADVASAYGALAAGLQCAVTNSFPREWAFPTIQWDPALGRIAGVAGLEQKLSVAADCGGRVVAVAAEQVAAAERLLEDLRQGDQTRFGRLCVRGVKPIAQFDRQARAIASCADDAQRKSQRALMAAVGAVTVAGTVAWGLSEYARRQEVERARIVAEAAPLLIRSADDSAFGLAASGLAQLVACAEDEDVRTLLLNQMRMRSWLVPVAVDKTRGACHDALAFANMLKTNDDVIAAAEAVLADKDGRLARRSEPAPVKVPKDWAVEYRSVAGMLRAVRKDTGDELWKSPMGFQVSTGVVNARNGLLLAVSYSPKHAVVGLDALRGTVVWSRATGTMLKQTAMSPDGKYWALLSQDRQVSVLETDTGRMVFETVRVGPDIQSLAFSDDSSQLCLEGAVQSLVCRLCPSRTLTQVERPGDQLLDWQLTAGGTRIEQIVQILVSAEKMAELEARHNRGETVSPDELASRLERQVYDLKSARVVAATPLSDIPMPWTQPNEELPFRPPSLSDRWKRIPSGGWVFGTGLMRQVHVCDERGRTLWSTSAYSTPGVIPFDVDPSGQVLAVAVANDEVQLFDVRSGAERSARWKQVDGVSFLVFAELAGEPLLFVGGGADDPLRGGPGYLSGYDVKLGVKCFEISGTRYRFKRCFVDAEKNVLFDDGFCRAVNGLLQPEAAAGFTSDEVRLLLKALTDLSWDEPTAVRRCELLARLGIGKR